MKTEQVAEILLEELAEISRENGGKPLVNLRLRAEQCGIIAPAFLEEVVAFMRSKYWIEAPYEAPNGGLYARVTLQGLRLAHERVMRSI